MEATIRFLFCNAVYLAVATYTGRNTLIFGQFIHLNKYLFKFMYNLREGIITVQ